MNAHISEAVQQQEQLKSIVSKAKVGAVEMYFMFRDLALHIYAEDKDNWKDAICSRNTPETAKIYAQYMCESAYNSAIKDFIVEHPDGNYSVNYNKTATELQKEIETKFQSELSAALESDIIHFCEEHNIAREKIEVILANALMLAEQNGGIRTYLFQ